MITDNCEIVKKKCEQDLQIKKKHLKCCSFTFHTLASTPENPKYKVKSRIAGKENRGGGMFLFIFILI